MSTAKFTAPVAKVRHFLQMSDFSAEEYAYLFERTRIIKDRFKRYELYHPLRDRTLAMVFEKNSTRTRCSFDLAIRQLGGVLGIAIVAVFVVAAIVTPPDPISQITLAIPLCLLYEVSIWCVWLIERRRAREEKEADV